MATRQWLYGITLSLSPLAFISLSPFIGHLSDKFGRKSVIGACLIASLVGFLLPIIGIYCKRVSLIMIGRFIAGAGTTSQPVAQAAITDFSTGNKRAFNLSLIGLSMTLAMVLGPLSGGTLSDPHIISWFNATTPYWAGTLLATVNLLLLYTGFHDTHVVITTASTKPKTLRHLFHPAIVGLLIVFLMMQLTWSAFYQSSFIFLGSQYHFSTNTISEFAAVSGLWMCLGLTIVFRYWLTVHNVTQIAAISIAIVLLGFIGLFFFNHQQHIWYIVAPIALFVGTAYPALLQLISQHTPADHQGWMLGVASTVLGLAWMVTGLFSARIVAHSMTLLISLCFSFLLIAIITIKLIDTQHDSVA